MATPFFRYSKARLVLYWPGIHALGAGPVRRKINATTRTAEQLTQSVILASHTRTGDLAASIYSSPARYNPALLRATSGFGVNPATAPHYAGYFFKGTTMDPGKWYILPANKQVAPINPSGADMKAAGLKYIVKKPPHMLSGQPSHRYILEGAFDAAIRLHWG